MEGGCDGKVLCCGAGNRHQHGLRILLPVHLAVLLSAFKLYHYCTCNPSSTIDNITGVL
jgi:hypothetical protein